MVCPLCRNSMEKGFLQSGKMMVWVKKKHYLSLKPKQGEIVLDRNYLTGSFVPSWICRNCEKIIIDYSDNDEGE